MSAADKINRKSYRDWVRGALGLSFLQEGLHPFTDRVVKAEHERIVSSLTKCSKPHSKGHTKHCQMYEKIASNHNFQTPSLISNCHAWYTDHWQFAKCFMTTTTKESNKNKTASDTDASGLLSIIINAKFFQLEVQSPFNPRTGTDIFSQARKKRNELLHNATQELEDYEVTKYLESMIAVLEDKKIQSIDPEAQAAQAAVKKLKEILKDKLNITPREEAKVMQIIQAELDDIKEKIRTLEQQKEDSTAKITELGKGHDNLEARVEKLEKRVSDLEHNIATLKGTKEHLQKRSKYLKDKLGLQQHLVDKYQKYYVKTWISPLMTQRNKVNIGDVYVSPSMKVDENENDNDGNITEVRKDRRTKTRHVERYCDLFGTNENKNKKIFIVGDVGTGKSSFCKMMLQNWSSSITKRRDSDDLSVMEDEDIPHKKEDEISDMDRFDFLFYIPLREKLSGTDDIIDMIKAHLGKYGSLVDEVFTNDSERILVLADGLDEWAHDGILKSSLAGDSTILTTSRPSSSGILNMESTDYDLKVTLLGLDKKSVTPMIEKYMQLLDKTSYVEAFKDILPELPFKDIHKAPMLLQQIIWLYCYGHDIGKARSYIYIQIINAVLGSYHGKMKAFPKLQSCSLKDLSLPATVADYPRCLENKELLLLLGKIACDAYITGKDSSLVFGRHKLKQLGVPDEDIETILQTGILTEVNCADPTYETTQLSFIHTSYVEFFAALYICSNYLSESSDSSSSNPFTILERLIAVTPETSVTEILRLENVLIMICGLDPRLTEHVCDCIYKLTPSDENTDYNINCQIHDLIEDCLSEHNSYHQKPVVKFKLRHICKWFAFDRGLSMRVSDLVPTSVETCSLVYLSLSHEQCLSLESCLSQAVSIRTLTINKITCTKDDCEGHAIDLTDHNELKSIDLSGNKISVAGINHTCLQSYRISYCKLSHEQCSLLSSCLSQAVSLRTLEIEDIKCTEDECESHTIELTNHKELQSIKLSGNKMSVSGINHTCLQSYRISDCKLSHEQYSLLSSCLSQVVSLRTLEISRIKCTKDECEGHTIYMTNHKELQSIMLKWCKTSVSGIKSKVLESYELCGCSLSHEQCTELSSCLSQATLLKSLELYDVECIKPECEGHCIDLSSQNQLRDIWVSRCDIITLSEVNRTCLTNHKQLLRSHLSTCNTIFITGINPTCLEKCDISNCDLSHEQCASLCSFLSQAESLYVLELSWIKCIEYACEGHHYIDLTNHKPLEFLNVSYCNMISITGTCFLTMCNISHCNLSHEQCASLCSFLSHAVSLLEIELSEVKCIEDACEGHYIDLTNHKQLERLKAVADAAKAEEKHRFCCSSRSSGTKLTFADVDTAAT
ncbi:uncharacterized protein LOC123531105 [Mercenaria mercenaria]|uniref:uncharacterized protein LOC123531105 n=1 Tax=Mercenaria mercenaria TaxID=6596 RepID=UPI00234E5E08|nr:uncharacterized protein LOC123531105 [Mercenaria mercenaria]